MSKYQKKLELTAHPARLFTQLADKVVRCELSPRKCEIKEGNAGFCQVRKNEGGKLVTLNYGVSVQMTQEFIETEAVAHFSPGAQILSLGNIGCMMACDFCHNWKTSQMKHVEKRDLNFYTPEEVVRAAIEKNIGILSWTYNDPVVWHEFVHDTATLAKKAGLLNLYKSAFSISPEAVDELHEVIDIFSLSLKSMDPEFYKRVTKGRLEPVLEAIKQVYDFGDRHLELSNLVVTGRNDNLREIERVVDWMLKNLDESVPLHLVRFHPDYRYTHVDRTSIPFLKIARERALAMGLKFVYLGNVYEAHDGLNTRCEACQATLVERFGLTVNPVGLSTDGLCKNCGQASPFKMPKLRVGESPISAEPVQKVTKEFRWQGDINAAHVVLKNDSASARSVALASLRSSSETHLNSFTLQPGQNWRFIQSKSLPLEMGFKVLCGAEVSVQILAVKDRAHFPVVEEFGRV